MATLLNILLDYSTLSGTNTVLDHFLSIDSDCTIIEKPGIEKGAILVIDEMDINIEVIETKLDFDIEVITYEMDVDLKVESNDLKFDIECL